MGKISDYCPTRFLSLYNMLIDVSCQYPLIKKFVQLSKDTALLSYFHDPTFVIELDPFFYSAWAYSGFHKIYVVSRLGGVYLLGELITILLQRLGHSVEVIPQKYINILYHRDGTPRSFQSKMKEFYYHQESAHVNAAMIQLSENEIRLIKQNMKFIQWETVAIRHADPVPLSRGSGST